ncbi:MAG: prepilin peptidase, partial [Candidatus Aureabacteria bacterium]|nr:prepilin peptidase [Candidatus Auribacterota bacterium]
MIPKFLIEMTIFLFGLCIGSFLNVCIYRIPKRKSIVFPASHCPKCKTPIPWYYNIPVISYIILRG